MHVGFLFAWEDWGDALWNQCDGPAGRHAHLRFSRFVPPTAQADPNASAHDHLVCWNIPYLRDPAARLRGWRRRLAKLRGELEHARHTHAWAQVPFDPDSVDVLMYEPPEAVSDGAYVFARSRAGRVWGPDSRAKNPVMLPSVYTFGGSLEIWRSLASPSDAEKVLPLVAVTSGASSLPGHAARAGFYERLRRAGLPLTLFGRGLTASTCGAGALTCKSQALLPARFCLAIENSDTDERYVSEKLWDALVAWCVPLYFGSRALERVIPVESFIRIPSRDQEGVATVAAALSDPGQYARRLEAIAEARRRALGPLRMVEFLASNIPAGAR
jgi:hypothetical protein